MSLRLSRFSGVRKNPRANCMVSVDPPCAFWPERTFLNARLHQAAVVHASVFEEPPILNCQYRLHEVRRNFVVGDQPPLCPIDVFPQARDEKRFKFIACEGLALVIRD